MNIRVAVYARVSTREQAQPEKSSIPDQIESCERAIREHKWEFHDKYIDGGVSGHLTEERPGLQAMLRDARAYKFNLVIVKDFDRFARNRVRAAAIREELKELGIQTYAITTPVEPRDPAQYDPDEDDIGVLVEGMSDINSDIERKKITRRLKMGKRKKAESGVIPNRIPYGYKLKRWINEKGKVVREVLVDTESAKIIRNIYNQYTSGLGVRKIAIDFNRRKIPSPKGSIWTEATMKYILRNPTYAGKVWWGWRHAEYKKTLEKRRRGQEGIITKGNHAPIIPQLLFDKAQMIQKQRAKGARGGTGRSLGLLTGLLKCIRCGKGGGYQKRRFKRSKQNPNWKDTETYEYICGGYKYAGICSQRIMSAQKLEGSVLDQLRNLYRHPKVQDKIVYKGSQRIQKNLEKDLAHLEREKNHIPERLKRQQEAFERALITVEEYGKAMQRLREDEKRTDDEITRIKTALVQLGQNVVSLEKFAATLKNFDALWDKMMLDEKKHILRTVIREIRAGNGRVEIDFVL